MEQLRRLGRLLRPQTTGADQPQLSGAQFDDVMQRAMRGETVRMNARKEQTKEGYLETLPPETSAQVEGFLNFAQELQELLGSTRIAVTAVGSSTQPATERYRPVGDVDLRVLNSEKPGSEERVNAISAIRDGIRGYLQGQGLPFEEADYTSETRMVESNMGLVPFVDWYNTEPSFITRPETGLPLHISISGVTNPPIDKYLQLEHRRNTTTVVLTQPSK